MVTFSVEFSTGVTLVFFYIKSFRSVPQFSISDLKVKGTLRPTVSRSVRLGVEPHLGLMFGYYYCLTVTVLSMSGVPSDERSGQSSVIVIVRPLLVNIYMVL
jgi:hypothetical protein